jgi:hypothetical protein
MPRRVLRSALALGLATAAACRPAPAAAPQDRQAALPAAPSRSARGRARFAPWLDAFVEPPEGEFVAISPLRHDSPFWACAARSERAYGVALSDGEVQFLPAAALRPRGEFPPEFEGLRRAATAGTTPRLVQPVEDGWLVALSGAEATGEVWWVSHDGRRQQMVVAKPVVAFVDTSHGLVAGLGSSWATSEHGELVVLRPREGSWRSDRLLDLGEVPKALAVDAQGRILLATPRSVLRVLPGEGATKLLHTGHWASLGPNSLTVDDDQVIHVGMRYGVARLTPRGDGAFDEAWMVPKSCPRLLPDADDACRCEGDGASDPPQE